MHKREDKGDLLTIDPIVYATAEQLGASTRSMGGLQRPALSFWSWTLFGPCCCSYFRPRALAKKFAAFVLKASPASLSCAITGV